jgi:hypothetical protein
MTTRSATKAAGIILRVYLQFLHTSFSAILRALCCVSPARIDTQIIVKTTTKVGKSAACGFMKVTLCFRTLRAT